MNYSKIHDDILRHASTRSHDKNLYQKHHIIPKHENKNSRLCVSLTYKEHYIIHFLRYKMGCGVGNKYAYLLLRFGNIDSKTHIEMSSIGGRIGGANTISNGKGIFSADWDRSAETTRRWQNGLMGTPYYKLYPEIPRKHAKSLIVEKRGIFSADWDRSKESKKYWNSLSVEKRKLRNLENKKNLALATKKSVELKKNFSGMDKEKQRELAIQGGKICGKIPMWTNGIVNKRSVERPGEKFSRGVTQRHKITKEKITHYKKDNDQ